MSSGLLQMLLQKCSNGIFYFRWVYPPALRKLLGKAYKDVGMIVVTYALLKGLSSAYS